MSDKKEFLSNINHHITEKYEMPDIELDAIQYIDPIAQFIESSKFVGGNALLLPNGEDINDMIKSIYPGLEKIASNLDFITIASLNPDEVNDPRELNGVDLAIVKAEVGIAENGCVWIPQNVKEKVLYFIAENLIIIINRENIVNNMHEAYEKISFNNYGFGTFISGPSKTADIEQALVIGAHGAKGVTVIIR